MIEKQLNVICNVAGVTALELHDFSYLTDKVFHINEFFCKY